MRFFRFFINIFRNYSYYDKLISSFAIIAILLMILKLMIFPYGLFSFGEANIYTEGLVSPNGIQSLNPLFIDYNEVDREISQVIFSGLMKYDSASEAVISDMASLEINEDKTEYSLTLREGLKWQDGTPITADDAYFTFNDIIMSSTFPNEILKANFAGVKIEKIDDDTLKFILEKPNVFFITNLTTGILPKHIYGNIDPADLLQHEINKMPVGSGPYKVTEPVASIGGKRMQITLEKNPYYYDISSEIEFLRFIVYPTMEKLIEESTVVNGIVKISGNYISDFENNERFILMPYKLPQYTAVFLNMENPILKANKNVRLALQKGVDKEALISKFEDKDAVDTPLMELTQDDWVYQPSEEEAQGALKDGGFTYADDDIEKTGLRYNEDGEPLEFRFIARLYDEEIQKALFDETKEVVTFLEESWEKIGMDIKVELLAKEDFNERIMQRDYDMLLLGQNLGYNLDTYSFWHSTQAGTGGQNLSNYKSFRVDSLIEDIRAVFNKEKHEKELNELAEVLKEDIPAIFLYRPVYYYATDGKINGLSMANVVFPSDRFSNLSNWKFY